MADDELSTEQLAAGGAVAGAAVEAAQTERTPAAARTAATRAARRRAAEVKMELSEDDAKLLASAVVDEIERRGGFDAPPEPVAPPPPPPAPQTQPAEASEVQAPHNRSFAERFRGR